MELEEFDHLFLGGLRLDYIITHEGRIHLGILGGNAAYAAAGARIWSDSTGIISRIGFDFPPEALQWLRQTGINAHSVRLLPEVANVRSFYAYLTPEERADTNAASHFLRSGHALPKELINIDCPSAGEENRKAFTPLAIRPDDLPPQTARCKSAHIAPSQFLSHYTLPVRLRELGVRLVTLAPSERYLVPSFQSDLPMILTGIQAFLPREKYVRSFFRPLRPGIWEMAEEFGNMGCRFVVIRCGTRRYCAWDSDARKRWLVPAYPSRLVDTTGAGSVFCGGFLVGLEMTGDPVEAALRGSVSASLAVEGSGALYALEATPGLAQARLEALRPSIKRV